MQVMEIQRNALQPAKRPIPVTQAGEVLIKVEAIGINRADLFQVQGSYPPPPGVSDLPGLEVAGTLVETGEKVCALLAGGGYAEYVTVPKELVLPIPAGLTAIEAAALPEACFTTWLNLFDQGKLQPGETVLIHAGASGIGTMAIQCAKAYGAIVFITASTKEKCDACRALGADYTLNYKEVDFVTVIKEITNGQGVDLLLDTIGGSYIQRNLRCLRVGGRMINLAFLEEATATVNFAPLLLKNLTWMGTTLRSQPLARKTQLADDVRTHLWPLIEKGIIRPVVDSVFPFEKIGDAHRYMELNKNIGKVVVTSITPLGSFEF